MKKAAQFRERAIPVRYWERLNEKISNQTGVRTVSKGWIGDYKVLASNYPREGEADRTEAVVFDVLETLLNLDPLAARLEMAGQPASLLEPWFMPFQRDAMALTLAGDAAPFEPVGRLEYNPGDVFLPADGVGESLAEVADRLLSLP